MARLKTLWKWLSTSDAALSWTERIAKFIVWGVSGGVFSTFAGTAIGLITGNPLSGLIIGVVAGMIILVGFALKAVGIASAGPKPITPGGGEEVREVKSQRQDNEQELEELRAAYKRLKAENEQLKNSPGNAELRQDSRQMASDLRQFLKDNSDRPEDQIIRPEDQIMELYRKRLLDKVSALLEELEENGLYPPPKRQSFEIAADKYPRSPMAINNLAKTLGTIGYRR